MPGRIAIQSRRRGLLLLQTAAAGAVVSVPSPTRWSGSRKGRRALAARNRAATVRERFRRKQAEQMKKKLSPAKAPLPKFQSDQDAAEYFESYSVAGVWDRL